MGLLLHHIFKGTHPGLALSLLTFVLIGTAVGFMSSANLVNVLTPMMNRALSNSEIETQVMFLLEARNNDYHMGGVFWGLWLLPLGLLVIQSWLAPKLLGVTLIIACFVYLFELVLKIQFSIYETPFYLAWLSFFAEIGICLWLLIVGVGNKFELRVQQQDKKASTIT